MNGPTPSPESAPARAAVANAEGFDWDNVDPDAQLPIALTPLGENASTVPLVLGVPLVPEVLLALDVLDAAHAIAVLERPGLTYGDLVAELRAAEVRRGGA